MTNWKGVITADPEIKGGKPVIAGTRVTVEFILEHLANGWSEQDLVRQFEITPEQIRACLAYAHDSLTDLVMVPLPGVASSGRR
jgi:uncharacterized protein (DUF433 family)